MEENINRLLVAKGVASNPCERFEFGDVVINFWVFHFKFRQVIPGSLLALAVSELIEKLGLEGLSNIGDVLSNRVQSIDPSSYGSGPFGDLWSIHECECQGHFTNR